jgi:hypothetical protein
MTIFNAVVPICPDCGRFMAFMENTDYRKGVIEAKCLMHDCSNKEVYLIALPELKLIPT